MNQRIQKLIEQATQSAMWPGDPDAGELDAEKFAQLIIQECAELTLSHRNDDYYNGWLDYRDEIRRHFGVDK